MKRICKLALSLMFVISLLLLSACANPVEDSPQNTKDNSSTNTPVDEHANEANQNPKIIIEGDVTLQEQDLIINGEKLIQQAGSGLTKYQKTGEDDFENALAITIDDESYAPMKDDFGYHSIAQLKQALAKYFTDEYIDTKPFFSQTVAAEYGIPVYYKDYNGELYMWDGGDYFGEASSYLFDNEMLLKTISRNDNSVVIAFSMYVKPMYAGNIWCTRHFTITDGKISAVEHISDEEPSTNDFIGNWAGYDEEGNFIQGYSFAANPTADDSDTITAIEYYADGTTISYDSCIYQYGHIMFGEGPDDDWLTVSAYSHDGLHQFTATNLKYDDQQVLIPSPTITFKRVNSISVTDGNIVIQ